MSQVIDNCEESGFSLKALLRNSFYKDASGNIYLGVKASDTPTPPLEPLLLDTYTGAAAAYSLRKLRAAYSGSAIRVREDSGNTEADIGFVTTPDVNGDYGLDTTALLAHVGANNGYIVTWYDQVGSADVTQATTTQQPKIVNSGSVVTISGKPSALFTSANSETLSKTGISISSASYSNFCFIHRLSLGIEVPVRYRPLGALGTVSGFAPLETNGVNYTGLNTLIDDGAGGYISANALPFGSLPSTTDLLSVCIGTTSNIDIWTNNSKETYTNVGGGSPSSYTITQVYLGSANGAVRYYNGYMSENILFSADKTSDRVAIQNDINTFYSIY